MGTMDVFYRAALIAKGSLQVRKPNATLWERSRANDCGKSTEQSDG
jgi:hypothetical protein